MKARIMLTGSRFKNRGVSLIELMVAMVISLVLMGGVVQVYSGTKAAYRINDETARIQEGVRFANGHLAKDIRMAGYMGCFSEETKLANTLNGSSTLWMADLGTGLRGYEGGVSTLPSEFSSVALPNTDAIVVVRGDTDDAFVVSMHNPNAASIHLESTHDLQQGEVLLISDCKFASVFQQSNVNNNNNISVVDHNTGVATDPSNCTKKLGSTTPYSDCDDTSTMFGYRFGGDAMLMRLSAAAYFIANNANGIPSLYRQRLVNGPSTTTTLTTVGEELVEGVENMQLQYGVDTTGDGVPNRYVTADVVDGSYDWTQVIAVRVNLMLRSVNASSPTVQKPFTYNNVTFTPTDKYVRRTSTLLVKVRNRGDR